MQNFIQKLGRFRFNKIPVYLKNRFGRRSQYFHKLYDHHCDMKVCGVSLTESVYTEFSESHGATNTIPTHYRFLDRIFAREIFTAEDHLLDVGCGNGRLLAYLLMHKFPGRLSGIELTPSVAKLAQSWTGKYKNVTVHNGDAFKLDLNQYTVFTMCEPFDTPTLLRFLEKLEREVTHSVRVFYCFDGYDGYFVNDRPGWIIQRREFTDTLRVLEWLPVEYPIHQWPQRFTVYKFDPGVYKLWHDRGGYDFKELVDSRDYDLFPGLDVDYCRKYDIVFYRTMKGLFWYKAMKPDDDLDYQKMWLKK